MKISEDYIKLRRAWISQLYEEYADIFWRYKIKIGKTIIEISESEKYWGQWYPELRTIKISEDLIKKHSWDVVINILKHEMAHQIVTQVFSGDGGHGELFQKACQMIGLPHDFRSASGDIPRVILDFKEHEIGSEKKKLLEKVNKLLSLAESKNEHEANLAMTKAQELIQKYNLERIKSDTETKYVYKIINHKKRRIENYQRQICSILSDFFFVDIVNSYLYDAESCDTHRTIELLGTLENVLMAEYVYFFLLNQIKSLWAHHQSKTGASFKEKRSYWLGIIQGFREKLELMEKKKFKPPNYQNPRPPTVSALVCMEDIMLKKFSSERFPRLFRRSHQYTKIYEKTYETGKQEGRNLNLYRGVTRKDGNQGRLLSIKR